VRITIERIRTLVLAAAVVLLAALGVFLVKARWKNLLSRHDLPQRLAKNIEQEASGYTFVHALGAHSQYTIHASREVELRNDRVELHDVQIDLYGEDGSRIDRIAGDTFEYDQKSGLATAQGPVEMLLTRPSASTAAAVETAGKTKGHVIAEVGAATGSAGQIDVKTSGVTFDRNSGLVTTAQQVNFSLTQGYGSAMGARYDSQSGYLTLEQAVELTTHRGGDAVQIHAQHAEFDRGARTCRLRAAAADYRGGQANAAQATILFREDGSVERLDATDGFTLATAAGGRLAAPVARMDFDEHNQPQRGRLEGGVTMNSAREGRTVHGTSPTAELAFTADGLLKSAYLERGVAIESEETSGEGKGQSAALQVSRTWRSPVVDIDFGLLRGTGKKQVEPKTMRGTGGVAISSEIRRGNGAATSAKMTADEVTGAFGPGSTLRAITGVGHAGVEQTTATGTRQTASGDLLLAQFAPVGGNAASGHAKTGGLAKSGAMIGGGEAAGAAQVQSAELDGHVVLVEQPAARPGAQPQPPMHATAGLAVYEGTGQWLHLTVHPRVEDGGLALTADKVDVSQQSGDAFAHGNVKATWTDTGAGGSGEENGAASGGEGQEELTLGGKGPAHMIAADAQLNASTGEATFRGHARLWQQANSVAGPVITLNQHMQTLVARSSDPAEPVRAVLVSASGAGAGMHAAQPAGQTAESHAGAKPEAPSVIRVRGGELWYSDAERRAVMRGGALGAVVAETGSATSSSDAVELRLLPAGNHEGGGGQAQVDRMTATGHVVLTWQNWRGTGEQLVYSGATGEYVLSGAAAAWPKMTNPERGTVTGEALIFHGREDSVSIEGGGRETRTETTAPEVRGK
jgi:lipopolysaccharide export system protein LptA